MKKRILSLILALSMVLSVFPLPELVMGAGGYPVCPDGTTGDGWEYKGGTLILKSGSYDFNYFYPKTNGGGVTEQTVHCGIKLEQDATITGGDFGANVTNDKGTISGGFFADGVTNSGTITGNGTFAGTVTNITGVTLPGGTISGGTFYGSVTNLNTIEKGTFEGNVTNSGTISGGTFAANKKVENYSYIENGTFEGSVTNYSYIENGTFNGTVTNEGANATIKNGTFEQEVINNAGGEISGGAFNKKVSNINGKIANGIFMGDVTNDSDGHILRGTFAGKVTNYGNINSKGTFNGTVENYGGTISSGTFKGTVENWYGTISGGTFHEKVLNINGEITGGTFAAGLSANHNTVTGGAFNGNTGLTGAFHVTVTNGSVDKVNGVVTTGTAWDLYSYKDTTMTITASTEIFSLNGQPIAESNYGVDKKTVKFTMSNENVVLNGAITCTDLVMEKGWPKASNEGKISCSGTGWEYIKKSSGSTNTGTLYLMSGSEPFDFNFADPATKITRTDAAVKCAIESYGTISGGIFDGTVTNNAGGEISDGTFKGDVENSGYIEKGTFNGEVTNNTSGTIFGGTFRGQVDNNGKITGGIFAAGLSTTPGTVTGGIFNGKTGLTDALHVTVTNGSVSQVNDEGPRNADGTTGTAWDLYSYKDTTVTITADTDIFSLNGQPIAESSYGSDKTTVTFTMPDDDVVLNKAITSTDLVMENGWPKDSNGGKNPCKGDGWEYIKNDPTNGNMLLLTGSNQTGGLFDFSTIGDGAAVECNVFVGKPTAITGGEFNGKVFNNSGILGGTFHGEVDNMAPGTIKDGTFKNSVENNGIIEKGTFHDAVKNNGTINDGTFNSPVDNTTMGRIENGAFHDEVKNDGTINDGAFNGKVENNKVINSGTFNGPVDNTTMGRIEDGMFNDAVENNGTIEKGTFHDEVKNSGTINSGTFHGAVENNGTINGGTFNGAVTNNGTVSESITGSGTLNGELITKPEPEPEPKPEPKPEPEPEPTTYTVTVIGGTIDGKTSVSAKENDTLTVVLDQNDIPDGMTFDMWSISSSKLSGDINVDYRAEAMTFQMPAEDVTIRAQYRSAEIIEEAAPSPLATAATIAVGGAAAGIVVWQGVNLGVDLYLANALPQGVPVPTDRRALALLLWETAGKPEVALPTLYGDIPAEEIELQKATHWAVQNGLMDAADKKDASFFDPDHYVTKMDVFGAWLRLKKLLGTIGTSPTQ